MQRLGREKEAQQVYTSVLKSKPNDIGLVAVASNNILAINRCFLRFPWFLSILLWKAEGIIKASSIPSPSWRANQYWSGSGGQRQHTGHKQVLFKSFINSISDLTRYPNDIGLVAWRWPATTKRFTTVCPRSSDPFYIVTFILNSPRISGHIVFLWFLLILYAFKGKVILLDFLCFTSLPYFIKG